MVHGTRDMQIAIAGLTSVDPGVAALSAHHTEEVHAAGRLEGQVQAVLGTLPGVEGRRGEDDAGRVQLVPAALATVKEPTQRLLASLTRALKSALNRSLKS